MFQKFSKSENKKRKTLYGQLDVRNQCLLRLIPLVFTWLRQGNNKYVNVKDILLYTDAYEYLHTLYVLVCVIAIIKFNWSRIYYFNFKVMRLWLLVALSKDRLSGGIK